MNPKYDDLRWTNFQMWGALNGMKQTKALIKTRFPHSSQSTNSDYEGPVLVSPVMILLIVTYLW